MTESQMLADKRRQVINAVVYAGWRPNDMQRELIRAYRAGKKFIFCRVGRKGGKTDGVIKVLYEAALETDGAAIYYIAPFIKQAKEIIWVNGRLPNALPPEMIKHVDKQELRITLVNGSFIKVDGSDNYDNWAGITPDLVVLDEFRSFKPQFYEVMNPNRGPKNAPLIIIGTPPVIVPAAKGQEDHQYLALWKQAKRDEAAGKSSIGLHFPSTVNDKVPHLAKFFEEEKEKLYALSQEDVWRREYLAEFTQSTTVSVFPVPKVFNDEALIKPHSEILFELARKKKDIEWGIIADPASASCFGVIFAAYDKWKSHVYYLGEIYEKRQSEMTADRMWSKIQGKAYDIFGAGWQKYFTLIYDEAAAWWGNELNQRLMRPGRTYDQAWIPSSKRKMDKADGISLLKDMFIQKKCTISSQCENLIWEVKNYHLVPKMGMMVPVKADDHLIDPMRYWNTFIGLDLTETPAIEREERIETHERFSRSPEPDESSMIDDGSLPFNDEELFEDLFDV